MQTQTTNGLKCPNCSGQMHGLSLGLHHFECSDCGTIINGVTVNSNALQGIFIALCIVGIVALIAGALE